MIKEIVMDSVYLTKETIKIFEFQLFLWILELNFILY